MRAASVLRNRGFEEDFRITGGVGLAELEAHFSVRRQREALLGEGRPHASGPGILPQRPAWREKPEAWQLI